MNLFKKLQIMMLLSLLLGLQDLDAAKKRGAVKKRERGAQAAASSRPEMVDEGDDVSDSEDHRTTTRAKTREEDGGALNCLRGGESYLSIGNAPLSEGVGVDYSAAASSSSFATSSLAAEALSPAKAASSSRAADGAGAELVKGSEVCLQAVTNISSLLGKIVSYLGAKSCYALGRTNKQISKDIDGEMISLKFKTSTPLKRIFAKVAKCPKLEELDIYQSSWIKAQDIVALVKNCSKLKKLNLKACRGAAGFIEKLPEKITLQLENLNLAWTDATANEVITIMKCCKKLKKLDLTYCRGAAGFIEDLPVGVGGYLEELNLRWTEATADQLAAIRARFPGCEIRV